MKFCLQKMKPSIFYIQKAGTNTSAKRISNAFILKFPKAKTKVKVLE
jgi:hypothetical protein